MRYSIRVKSMAENAGPKFHYISDEEYNRVMKANAERLAGPQKICVAINFEETMVSALTTFLKKRNSIHKSTEKLKREGLDTSRIEEKEIQLKDLKIEGDWNADLGETGEGFSEIYDDAFSEYFGGGKNAFEKLLKDQKEFLKIMDKNADSTIVTTLQHPAEDAIKDYIKEECKEQGYYDDTNGYNFIGEDGKRRKISRLNAKQFGSTVEMLFGDGIQRKFTLYINDGKAFADSLKYDTELHTWESLISNDKKILLVDKPYNKSIIVNRKLEESGIIRRVADVNEALETVNILYVLAEEARDPTVGIKKEQLNAEEARLKSRRRLSKYDKNGYDYLNGPSDPDAVLEEGTYQFIPNITLGDLIVIAHEQAIANRMEREKIGAAAYKTIPQDYVDPDVLESIRDKREEFKKNFMSQVSAEPKNESAEPAKTDANKETKPKRKSTGS